MLEDSITPLERQLYFTTAHAHFKAGCPALALEVLSKLPGKVMESAEGVDSPGKIIFQLIFIFYCHFFLFSSCSK